MHVNRIGALVALAAAFTSAADITFASHKNCTGLAIYGGRNFTTFPCYSLATEEDKPESVITDNLTSTQRFHFYSDAHCQTAISTISSAACYTPAENTRILSFQLVDDEVDDTSIHRGPHTRLTPYKDLPQTSPYDVDALHYSILITAAGLSVLAGFAATLGGFIIGCAAVDGPDPVPIIACLAAPVATAGAAGFAYLVGRYGEDLQAYYRARTGTFQDGFKRGETDVTDLVNELLGDYMSLSTNTTMPGSRHVGYMRRNMSQGHQPTSVQTSPLYEFEMNNKKWHMAPFFDLDSERIVHHMHEAPLSGGIGGVAEPHSLDTRSPPYAYNTIRWASGGLDFTLCSGSFIGTSGWGTSGGDNYGPMYDQLTCQYTAASLSGATNVVIDGYNENLGYMGAVAIVPFAGSGSGAAAPCPNSNNALDQSCFVS